MLEFENGAFHPRSAESERSSGCHPLQSQSFAGSSQAVCLRQRLKQRDRALIWGEGKAWDLGTGLGIRAAAGIRPGLGGMAICPGESRGSIS